MTRYNKTKHTYRPISRSVWSMIIILCCATLLRLVMLWYHYPNLNSDQAIIGLIGRHIINKGEHPIFFYGQSYMGTLEGYLAALFFFIAGSSSFTTLNLGLILINILFLYTLYELTRRLYSQSLAFFTLILLTFGSTELMQRYMKGIGGYPEMLLLGALMFLLTLKLTLTAPHTSDQRARLTTYQRWQRAGLYAALGFCMGFSFYTDPLSVVFIIPILLLLIRFCRRELFSLGVAGGILALLLGMAPLIYYNIHIYGTSTENTLQNLLSIQQTPASQMARLHIPAINKFYGTFFISLPTVTSYNTVCTPAQFHNFDLTNKLASLCMLEQGSWSLGYLFLMGSAFGIAGWQLVRHQARYRHRSRQASHDTASGAPDTQVDSTAIDQAEDYRQIVIQSTRIALLLSALLTLLVYAVSSNPAVSPDFGSRYLSNMLVATPALLWPLWNGLRRNSSSVTLLKKINTGMLIRVLGLLLIAGMFIKGTVEVIRVLPASQAAYVQEDTLIHNLEAIGATHIYTDYWTCYRMAFQSQEHIVCANLDDSLKLQGSVDNRYMPYVTMVRNSTRPAFVFSSGSAQDKFMLQQLSLLKARYIEHSFDGYHIYQFIGPVPIPIK
ncbi:hypothetical protein ccbrp13_40770 [Ktedonobacteria bacterium brp13]|nr:hypothetical protein ccbrp13_40770 [Ktedonobacteria bacterium brp13]